MKRFTSLMLGIIFSLSVFAQIEDSISAAKPRNTRIKTIAEVLPDDSTKIIFESPLLQSFEGIGLDPVKEAYKINRQTVDSILAADSLNPNFWRVYTYQAVNLFAQANQSPKMAMSLFLPWFIILFMLIVLMLGIKTIFIRPRVSDATKPENDSNISIEEPADENVEASPPEGGEAAGSR